MNRAEALSALRSQVEQGLPVVGAGAGTGLSAKSAEAGGADLIIIYNSGRFRMAGRGSLAGMMPYGDANAIVMEMANEVLPVVRRTPVLAGVCGTDPFRLCRSSSTRSPVPASRACRTSRPSGSSTASSGPTWRRPAWASTSRSR